MQHPGAACICAGETEARRGQAITWEELRTLLRCFVHVVCTSTVLCPAQLVTRLIEPALIALASGPAAGPGRMRSVHLSLVQLLGL